MKAVLLGRTQSSLYHLNATRVTATIIGVILGLAGFNHGFFEFLRCYPCMSNPDHIQNTALILMAISAILNVISFIAGFGHELRKMDQSDGYVS
jgi:hypothetical protein